LTIEPLQPCTQVILYLPERASCSSTFGMKASIAAPIGVNVGALPETMVSLIDCCAAAGPGATAASASRHPATALCARAGRIIITLPGDEIVLLLK
jgi:hypothetical protein